MQTAEIEILLDNACQADVSWAAPAGYDHPLQPYRNQFTYMDCLQAAEIETLHHDASQADALRQQLSTLTHADAQNRRRIVELSQALTKAQVGKRCCPYDQHHAPHSWKLVSSLAISIIGRCLNACYLGWLSPCRRLTWAKNIMSARQTCFSCASSLSQAHCVHVLQSQPARPLRAALVEARSRENSGANGQTSASAARVSQLETDLKRMADEQAQLKMVRCINAGSTLVAG